MDPKINPYAPGAGTQPPELTGRTDLIGKADIALARTHNGLSTKSFIYVGLRGVGKTVLLNRVKRNATAYKTAYIEAHENKPLSELLVYELRRILLSLDRGEQLGHMVKTALSVLRNFAKGAKLTIGDVGLGVDIAPGIADSGDLETDLTALFVSVAEAARDRRTSIVIIIDELQYLSEEEFSALIMALHKIAQERLPLILVGAGLPQIVGLAGRSKSYAERLFDYPEIGPLNFEDTKLALVEPAERGNVLFSEDALQAIYKQTQGYPYFVQEWGYHCWNLAQTSVIGVDVVKQATAIAIQSLDASFFRVRFDRLTPREKAYMWAMAQLGSGTHRSGEIARQLKVQVRQVAPLRSWLINKGMVYSPAHGDTAFTVPLFDAYLRRMMPHKPEDLVIQEIKLTELELD